MRERRFGSGSWGDVVDWRVLHIGRRGEYEWDVGARIHWGWVFLRRGCWGKGGEGGEDEERGREVMARGYREWRRERLERGIGSVWRRKYKSGPEKSFFFSGLSTEKEINRNRSLLKYIQIFAF